MKLSNIYWSIFEESGKIDAYLEYKDISNETKDILIERDKT